MSSQAMVQIPSWMRWPPNCCETCTGWKVNADDRWIGVCNNAISLDCGTKTDARYRCPNFERKSDKRK